MINLAQTAQYLFAYASIDFMTVSVLVKNLK